MNYKSPKYKELSFTCPYCNVLAEQKWNELPLIIDNNGKVILNQYWGISSGITQSELIGWISISTCWHCKKYHIWIDDKMIIPNCTNIPLPVKNMPEKVREIYNEARHVYSKSPKAAAALLRLAVQYLCVDLGENGKNINNDIGNLVKK